MTIESFLEELCVAQRRIATAVERQNLLFEATMTVRPPAPRHVQVELPPLPGTPIAKPPALPPETAIAAAAEPVKAAKKTKAAKATAPAEAAPAAAQAISQETAVNAVMDVANTVGRQAAIAIMAKFGAVRASELKPDTFAAVLTACAAAKAAQPAPAAKAVDSLI